MAQKRKSTSAPIAEMNSMTTTKPYGLILAGGKSSRMGRDKKEVAYFGRPQYQFLHDLLTPYCDAVFISLNKNQSIPSSYPTLHDQFEIEGPLNGILTAFQFDESKAWLTVPVDMPLIDNSTIEFLLSNRNEKKVATCFWDSDEKYPEPLLTIWEPQSATLIKNYFDKGGLSPREFLIANEIKTVEYPQPEKLLNINSPEELDRFLKNPEGFTN